jgi:small GTP-binding protein
VDSLLCKVHLWDTGGQELYRTLTSSYFRGSNGMILMYDTTEGMPLDRSVGHWEAHARDYGADQAVAVVVGTKADLTASRVIEYSQLKEFAEERGQVYYECSSKTGYNVNNVINAIVRSLVAKERSGQVKTRVTQNRIVLDDRSGPSKGSGCQCG